MGDRHVPVEVDVDVKERCKRLSISLVGVGLFAVSCHSGDVEAEAHEQLAASGTPYFSDIPVPEGFWLVDDETSDYMTSGLRYARHVYEGRSDPVAVRDFFHRQMPLNRWMWIDTQNESGLQLLRFQKAAERCDITVTRETKGWTRTTILRIRISPTRPPGAAQPKERT